MKLSWEISYNIIENICGDEISKGNDINLPEEDLIDSPSMLAFLLDISGWIWSCFIAIWIYKRKQMDTPNKIIETVPQQAI